MSAASTTTRRLTGPTAWRKSTTCRTSRTLDKVLASGVKEIPAEAAECAVAAAEVIARLLGTGGDESPYSESADEWVRAHPGAPPDALVKKALTVVDRIVRAPSELLDLWNETEDAGAWTDAVAELRARLT